MAFRRAVYHGYRLLASGLISSTAYPLVENAAQFFDESSRSGIIRWNFLRVQIFI